jgi:hypothetical protein
MTYSNLSTRALRHEFAAEVNAAASLAASACPVREATVNPRSAFWIALGQVAQGQKGRSGAWRANFLAELVRRVWQGLGRLVARRPESGAQPVSERLAALRRVAPAWFPGRDERS